MKKSDLTREEFKRIRIEVLKLSPTEMAARLGISASCVYYYESGQSLIPFAIGELVKNLKI